MGQFDLNFLDPCIDANFVSLTDPGQTDPTPDAYTGNLVEFTYNDFTITAPSFCLSGIEAVSCNNVSP